MEVCREVVAFFTRHTESSEWERPKLDAVHFYALTEEQNAGLVTPFEACVIEEVVKGVMVIKVRDLMDSILLLSRSFGTY